jgi:hypothetical protein
LIEVAEAVEDVVDLELRELVDEELKTDWIGCVDIDEIETLVGMDE